MTEFFKFVSENPWIAFFLCCIVADLAGRVFVSLPNRIMRHWNISKHGYPSAYCDDDGDVVRKKEKTPTGDSQ